MIFIKEEEEDNDIRSSNSNSKLSVLASSIFNSMKGIEESHTVSIKSDAGDESINVQGTVFSLRKTRSGRVVQYHGK